MVAVHDPATCPVCAPIMATDAWRAGQERAAAMHPIRVASPLMEQLQAGDPVDLGAHDLQEATG